MFCWAGLVSDMWKLNLVVHQDQTKILIRASLSQFYIIKLGTFYFQHHPPTASLIEIVAMGREYQIFHCLYNYYRPDKTMKCVTETENFFS